MMGGRHDRWSSCASVGKRNWCLRTRGASPLTDLSAGPWRCERFCGSRSPYRLRFAAYTNVVFIHKDIEPANVLVNSATDQVWLTGFGIASRLPRERRAPEPPEFIAGTLAYMAPEQTGRMNRAIDSRSDLYALGVTLYQMLTGSLPFTAADPMEWVHCHIARKPPAPSERLENVPAPVSQMITKLLAKTAEGVTRLPLALRVIFDTVLPNGRVGAVSTSFHLGSMTRQIGC